MRVLTGWRVGVVGGSIALRLTGGLTLVVAAHGLSVREFGFFAICFSVSLAVAGLLGSGLLDTLTYAQLTQHHLLVRRWSIVTAAILSTVVALSSVGHSHATEALDAGVVATASIVPTASGAFLRARGQLLSAATTAYWIPVVFRIAALGLSVLTTGSELMKWLAAGACGAAFVSTWMTNEKPRIDGNGPQVSRARSPMPMPMADVLWTSAAVAVLWGFLGQLDVWSIGLLYGSKSVAEYVPEMRTFEALTAVTTIVTFGASKRLLTAENPVQTSVRIAAVAGGLYLIAGLALLGIGGWIVRILFANSGRFSVGIGLAFIIGYTASAAVGVVFQGLMGAADYRSVAKTCVVGIAIAIAVIPLLTLEVGRLGAALGDSIAYVSVLPAAVLVRRIGHLRTRF